MAAILIVEDEHALGNALSLAVLRLGHTPVLAASGAAALARIGERAFEAIVLDIGLPDISGLEVLAKIREAGSKVPVLVITAHATLDHTISSRKLGVAECLFKPIDLQRFEEVISAMVTRSIAIAAPGHTTAGSLIGAAPAMHRVFLGIARACSGDSPVLIHGPSGTGKTLAARAIHANGSRSGDALRLVECSTLTHLEALQDACGTLVLKGIDALSPSLQGMLAAALEREDAPLPRLIATMQRDPREAGEGRGLREDLFYAFGALTIAMPPLRERSGDIPALSRFFHGMHGESSFPFEIAASTLAALQAYPWPGNVRELRHVIEHGLAMSRSGPLLPGHLPPHVAAAINEGGGAAVAGELDAVIARWLDSTLEMTPEDKWQYDVLLEEIESSMLRHLLERFDNRPTRLAAALRMNRATLRQKLRRGGIS
ncbi:sigma-54-dependent Fis family transcriptional regulator [Akkermansiaceae bacterium]|nr:sigma-54-dependent Fis family transcriptional regulator [Akkermansiaceae bacterium]